MMKTTFESKIRNPLRKNGGDWNVEKGGGRAGVVSVSPREVLRFAVCARGGRKRLTPKTKRK